MKRGSSSLSLKAPAKINWFLKIIGKRDDGYHDIVSLMQSVSLFDSLYFEHSDAIEVVSNSDIPLKNDLVYKAASLLKQYSSYRKGAKIVLRKDIPIGAGLGGGSSDAAYTLLGLDALWGLGLNEKELISIGADLGSDIPFFLNPRSALVEGRGEKITRLEIGPPLELLLIKPPLSISTAWAYASFDKRGFCELTKKAIDIKLFCRAFEERDYTSLSTMLYNDLEKVVIESYPVVGEIKNRLLEEGAVLSAMSGSGPTVFGVFKSKKIAVSVAREMDSDRAFLGWCMTVKTLVL